MELKLCPFCGNKDVKIINLDWKYRVKCWSCIAEGPLQDMKDEAITAWNTRQGEV